MLNINVCNCNRLLRTNNKNTSVKSPLRTALLSVPSTNFHSKSHQQDPVHHRVNWENDNYSLRGTHSKIFIMGCTSVPNSRRVGRVAGKRRPGQPRTSEKICPSEPPIFLSPFPTKFDVFRHCNIPDPLRCHPPFTGSKILEAPKDFTKDPEIAEAEQETYEAYSTAFHASYDSNKQTAEKDNTSDLSDSQSFSLSSSSASSSFSHLPPLPSSSSSSSSSSSITLSSPSTLHPHYLSPIGLSILHLIRTHLCLPPDLPPSHLIVHLIRRWERARVAVAQKNAELAAQANALDWSGVEDEEAVDFLDLDERDVLNTWAEAQKNMENRKLCPLFGAWGYTESAKYSR